MGNSPFEERELKALWLEYVGRTFEATLSDEQAKKAIDLFGALSFEEQRARTDRHPKLCFDGFVRDLVAEVVSFRTP